jgi:hypothetical protein
MTKDEFFPVYDQFMKVFTDRDPAQVKKLKQAENAFRSSSRSKDVLNTRRTLIITDRSQFLSHNMSRRSEKIG